MLSVKRLMKCSVVVGCDEVLVEGGYRCDALFILRLRDDVPRREPVLASSKIWLQL